jgi:hypothetical protein
MTPPNTPSLTLTDFLLARLAEDEAVAKEAIEERRRVRYVEGHPANDPDYADHDLIAWPDSSVPALLVGPERVLADVEAKRRIVEWVTGAQAAAGDPPGFCAGDAPALTYPLRHLAAVYGDHPDYREEWRP